MPLVAPLLGSLITLQIPLEIQKKFPQAIPTPFQRELANAVAQGIVTALKAEAKGVGAVGPTAVGPGIGIFGLSSARMVAYAQSYFMGKVGAIGVATEPILTAVFTQVMIHLLGTTVVPLSGFGGPLVKIVGLLQPNVTKRMIDAFPDETRQQLLQSQHGRTLVEAISFGFCTEVLSVGIPGPIPAAGVTVGPVVASFS
jgi:hypothetical protein